MILFGIANYMPCINSLNRRRANETASFRSMNDAFSSFSGGNGMKDLPPPAPPYKGGVSLLNPLIPNDVTRFEEIGDFKTGGLGGVTAVSRVALDVSPEILTNGSFRCLFRVGRPHRIAPAFDSIFSFKAHHHARAARHIFYKTCKEGFSLMNGIKPFRLFGGELQHFHPDDFQAAIVDSFANFPDDPFLQRVRLDDCQCFFECHIILPLPLSRQAAPPR